MYDGYFLFWLSILKQKVNKKNLRSDSVFFFHSLILIWKKPLYSCTLLFMQRHCMTIFSSRSCSLRKKPKLSGADLSTYSPGKIKWILIFALQWLWDFINNAGYARLFRFLSLTKFNFTILITKYVDGREQYCCNTVVSAYTLYRHLQQYCSHHRCAYVCAMVW